MKRRYSFGFVFVMLLCAVLALSGCGRHRYTERERNDCIERDSESVARRNMLACFGTYPEDMLDYLSLKADLIVEAVIESDGVVGSYPMFMLEDGPGPLFTCTRYDAVVKERWYGPDDSPAQNDHFVLELYGDEEFGAMKVRKGDKVVLFLRYVEDENLYYPVEGANGGCFVVNPPADTMFAFSPLENLIMYDKEKVASFREMVDEKIQTFKMNNMDKEFGLGDVGKMFEAQAEPTE